jgi:hypothetical protein
MLGGRQRRAKMSKLHKEQLFKAFVVAINKIGLSAFKATTLFGSNE